MDKYRKATIELCAAIELAKDTAHELPEYQTLDAMAWRAVLKLVYDIEASFNHSMQYRYEQHLKREKDLRALARKEPSA